jgi:hypothetical protein
MRSFPNIVLTLAALLCILSLLGRSQGNAASLSGKVLDITEASIPGATVLLIPANGSPISSESNGLGQYHFSSLRPGSYQVQVTSVGFQSLEVPAFQILAGVNTRDFTLDVFLIKQEVTVEADNVDSVSVDMASNAGALVLKAEDLEALSDDPDALSNELQALAGPSAGPSGGAQIFVDGFSGGRVPPKQSIREIRINRDPYSAEFDRPGFGRMEIFTKPGSDQFRGQAFFNFSDESLNSRNPFATNRAAYQTRNFGGNVSGPINRKTSFFLDFERREIDDNAVVNATTLDDLFRPSQFSRRM